ncbi:hypothetical protein K435DRAFT_799141 [Dendrothele bispora CBS 962.96]|uniref:Uncharacterized protein n=1 Tax=Dendrothele bispora (strain CBS 962.96) TaxID=1314807 RepID=A0A4S8LX64_DENBC|nr:hypothetical protein K435DRAFT_799141 [Dendrothele bispora CBS 962.96]
MILGSKFSHSRAQRLDYVKLASSFVLPIYTSVFDTTRQRFIYISHLYLGLNSNSNSIFESDQNPDQKEYTGTSWTTLILEQQMQTSTGLHFFPDAQSNDFRNAQITNVAGNLNIIKGDNGLSSDTKKITADMIASATPAVPIVFTGRKSLLNKG